ncbi:MAG: hypothetical protein ACRCSN_15725 [Dermatophilaceae bacterium]
MNPATWMYLDTDPGVWTVGFYTPTGQWITDSDHDTPDAAADRCHYLNGRPQHRPRQRRTSCRARDVVRGPWPNGGSAA